MPTIRTYTKEVYSLDEVRQKAIKKNWDINVDYEWWDCTYEDAKMVGINITSFDLDRNRHANSTIANCQETAELIIANHGTECETYKTASMFLAEYKPIKEREIILERLCDNYCTSHRYQKFYTELQSIQAKLEDLQDNFKQSITEDYSILLQREYNYLTSEEAILETLQANEYEFDEDGNIV